MVGHWQKEGTDYDSCMKHKKVDQIYSHVISAISAGKKKKKLILTPSGWNLYWLYLKLLKQSQSSACDAFWNTAQQAVAALWFRLTGWLADRLIDWLNKTHFSIPDRGLMARTVFWVLCRRSTSSVSISSSPQRLQPTAEQMYRSWGKQQEGKLQRG